MCTQVHQLPAGNNTLTVELYLVYMLENQKHIETTKNHDIQLRLIFIVDLAGFFHVALFCLFRCHDGGAQLSRRTERPRVTGVVHDEDGREE